MGLKLFRVPLSPKRSTNSEVVELWLNVISCFAFCAAHCVHVKIRVTLKSSLFHHLNNIIHKNSIKNNRIHKNSTQNKGKHKNPILNKRNIRT